MRMFTGIKQALCTRKERHFAMEMGRGSVLVAMERRMPVRARLFVQRVAKTASGTGKQEALALLLPM